MSPKNAVLVLLSISALTWAGIRIFTSGDPMQNPLAHAVDAHERAGELLGERVAKDLDRNGSILLLAPPAAPEGLAPGDARVWMTRQTEGFVNALPDSITVQTLSVAVAQTREAHRQGGSGELQWKDLRKAIENHPKVTAIVSLAGCPAIPANADLPPFYVLSRSGDRIHAGMTAGRIPFAVVPNHSPVAMEDLRGDWFSVFYETVTPETIGAWHEAVQGPGDAK